MKSKKGTRKGGNLLNFFKKKLLKEKTPKEKTPKERTLKERLQQRIGEKDICCETDFNRDIIIQMIIENYKKYAAKYNYENKNEYLNFITNDLVIFIGYKVNLANDKNGTALWEDLDRELGGKNPELIKIKTALKEVPLSFLLAFLGASAYKLKSSFTH